MKNFDGLSRGVLKQISEKLRIAEYIDYRLQSLVFVPFEFRGMVNQKIVGFLNTFFRFHALFSALQRNFQKILISII